MRKVKVKEGERYFIKRNGAYFRPEARGYTGDLGDAGTFDAKTADSYQREVEGITIISSKKMRAEVWKQVVGMIRRTADLSKLAEELQKLK